MVIISALRSPICRSKRGALKDCPADDLLAAVLKATLEQTGIEPSVCSDPQDMVFNGPYDVLAGTEDMRK